MFNWFCRLFGWEDRTFGAVRSSKWPAFRKRFLKGKICAICGGKDQIELHHKQPFHLKPELELDPNNVAPLCEKNDCHLRFGHLYNFRSFNPDIENDSIIWSYKIKHRP